MSKIFKTFFLTMMIAALCAGFTSCGSDDDEDEPIKVTSVVGKWQQTNSYGTTITISFKKDATGSIFYQFTSGSDKTEYFEYRLQTDSDGDQTIFITSDDCQLSGTYDVILTPSTLTLSTYISGEGNVQYKFNKVK